jgi:hypothetical protein
MPGPVARLPLETRGVRLASPNFELSIRVPLYPALHLSPYLCISIPSKEISDECVGFQISHVYFPAP